MRPSREMTSLMWRHQCHGEPTMSRWASWKEIKITAGDLRSKSVMVKTENIWGQIRMALGGRSGRPIRWRLWDCIGREYKPTQVELFIWNWKIIPKPENKSSFYEIFTRLGSNSTWRTREIRSHMTPRDNFIEFDPSWPWGHYHTVIASWTFKERSGFYYITSVMKVPLALITSYQDTLRNFHYVIVFTSYIWLYYVTHNHTTSTNLT